MKNTLARRRAAVHHGLRHDPTRWPPDEAAGALHAAAASFRDAMTAELAVSSIALRWSERDAARAVATLSAIGDAAALAALRAVGAVLPESPAAGAAAELAACGVPEPDWGADAGAWRFDGAMHCREAGRSAVFVQFRGAGSHVVAAFAESAGARLFLTEPGLEGLRDEWRRRGWTLMPCGRERAAALLSEALALPELPSPAPLDVRLLARRRLAQI